MSVPGRRRALALVIAMPTVCNHWVQVVRAKPVAAFRYEEHPVSDLPVRWIASSTGRRGLLCGRRVTVRFSHGPRT
jgi:hypothetical protein